jgi:large subunit ribosomal protein L24
MKIHKGDTVIVNTGKDRGKSGTVLRAFPKKGKVIVEGINIVKKHQKAKSAGTKGQTVERTMPLPVANVSLKDPKGGKMTRVSYNVEGKKKVRVATKSGVKL